ADVEHVSEHVARGILRARRPDVGADAPVDRRQLTQRVAVGVEPADQHEAAAVQQLAPEGVELRAEARQGEIVAADRQQIALAYLRERRVELAALRGGEMV